MFVIRAVLVFTALFVLGLGVAWVVTRDRRYLRYAGITLRVVLLLVVAFGLLYVFERVLLMI